MKHTLPARAAVPSGEDDQRVRDLLYRSLFAHAPVEVHVWRVVRDHDDRIVTWRLVDANPVALRSWGRTLNDVVGRTTEEIFPGAHAVTTFLPLVEEIMATGVAKEWQTHFTGTEQVLRMISIPVGEYFVSTGFDVTGDRQREQELQDALRSLTQATQAGGVGLWDWNLLTDRVRYSDEWKRQLGYAPEEISDSFDEWRSRVHPDDLTPTVERIRLSMEDPSHTYSVVFRMRHKDGTYRWILAQSSIIPDEQGRPHRMLGSHVDITERRRLEDRVAATQRLESLGTLAAGIAHDFNNLLGAIVGNLSLLRETPPSHTDSPLLLKELDEAARRATALTRQLLTFAKGGSPVRDIASIRDVLIESATFVTRGSNARCAFSVADDLATVEADVGQLSQVINNLVINAMQAMPHGGTIDVAARNVVLDAGNAWGLAAGAYVWISVTDEGTGIPDDVLPRIFDPFFTTKATGSGLGLSGSYSIIARHGGHIAARSAPKHGATFDILLPASGAKPHVHVPSSTVAGQGRILVMDDDSALRTLMQRMLSHLGYECHACGSGQELLYRFEQAMQEGWRYDAVILDLTIPGDQGGVQLLPALQQLDPHVVAIVTSGYADADVLAHHERHGFHGRLQKPVDLASLSTELSRALAAAGATVRRPMYGGR